MPPAVAPPATTSAQALGNLQGFQSSMQSPDAIVSGTEQGLGVPQAQQNVSGLRQAITSTTNLLNNVAPSVMGRTENSLVTSAQAGRQIANESAPIAKTLSDQTSKAGQAESDLQALLGKAGNLESLKSSGQQSQLTNLEDIYKTLYGQEQDKAASADSAAKQAEAVREFNASLGEKTAADSVKTATLSPSQQKAADQSQTLQNLQSVQGSDGHVNEANWAKAMNDWISAGYSASDFVTNFGHYINPKYSSTYQGSGSLF